MNQFELNINSNKKEVPEETGEDNKNENIKYSFENLSKPHLESIKSVIDNISPYLDHKVEIKFLDFSPDNPGMHSALFAKFKAENDYDSISINSNFEDKNQIPYYLLHELGHAFEEQFKELAIKKGLQIYPEEGDARTYYFKGYEFGEFQADFLVAYVMDREYVEKNIKTELEKNNFQIYNELFLNNNFAEIKTSINENEAEYRADIIKQYESGEIEKPEWLNEDYIKHPIYMRAFSEEINMEYKEYFNNLEKKYKKRN